MDCVVACATGDRITAALPVQRVIVRATDDLVVAGVGVDCYCLRLCRSIERFDTDPTVDPFDAAGPEVEDDAAIVHDMDLVESRPTIDQGVVAVDKERVVAFPAEEPGGAGVAAQLIIAGTAHQRIRASLAEKPVIAIPPIMTLSRPFPKLWKLPTPVKIMFSTSD